MRGFRPFLGVLGILVSFSGLAYAADPKEDWNFTPEDYRQLTKAGGKLRFSSEAKWLPLVVRKNLLTTLNYVLNPSLKPSSTDGVNVNDFYHGHIGCEFPNELGAAPGFSDLDSIKQKAFTDKGLEYYSFPSGDLERIKTYLEVTRSLEQTFGKILKKVVARPYCKRLVVVYHTYEIVSPADGGMAPGDPRRNLLTRAGDTAPRHYSPPDIGNASSWLRDYRNIFQFAFLIDRYGVIHVTWGSTTQLQRFTGVTE